MASLTTTLAAGGTAVLIADYLDRRLGVSHDVNMIRKLLRLKREYAGRRAQGEEEGGHRGGTRERREGGREGEGDEAREKEPERGRVRERRGRTREKR